MKLVVVLIALLSFPAYASGIGNMAWGLLLPIWCGVFIYAMYKAFSADYPLDAITPVIISAIVASALELWSIGRSEHEVSYFFSLLFLIPLICVFYRNFME